MVAGGGEMGGAPGVSRVPRAALAAFVTCPLCKGYFREASAFAECGHTCEFSLLSHSRRLYGFVSSSPLSCLHCTLCRPAAFLRRRPVFFATSRRAAVPSAVAVASRCVCFLSLSRLSVSRSVLAWLAFDATS